MFTLIWIKEMETPDEPTRFCCFPCLIPMKYIPLCFFVLAAILGYPIPPLLINVLLGYYQFAIRKQSLLKLPMTIYKKFDNLMPEALKKNPGYIRVANV